MLIMGEPNTSIRARQPTALIHRAALVIEGKRLGTAAGNQIGKVANTPTTSQNTIVLAENDSGSTA